VRVVAKCDTSRRLRPPRWPVRVAIRDDYFDTLHTLPCFARLAPFDVTIFNDHCSRGDQIVAWATGAPINVIKGARPSGADVAEATTARWRKQRR
jgi:hypothetical protein